MPRGDESQALYRVLGLLEHVRRSGTGWEASCPVSARHKHQDRNASLSIATGYDGRVLLNCKVGCTVQDITSALGIGVSDLFEKSKAGYPLRRYRMLAPSGNVLALHVREDRPEGKEVWWESHGKRGLNGTAVEMMPLYRAPNLVARPDDPVIVCEGEKAADALADLGLLAVGTVTGAGGTPGPEALSPLRGREVWLWPDNDDVGRDHMTRIAAMLPPPVGVICWPDAPEGGDAADYVEQGHSSDDVLSLMVESDGPASDGPASERQSGPRLDVVRMSDVTPVAVKWQWKGRLAKGKATLMMGDPGLGKSLISDDCAARISRGTPWPDGSPCERGNCLIFTIEDGLADTVAPRLIAANADMSRILAVRGVLGEDNSLDARMFELAEHLDLLETTITEERISYVVWDPITAYLGAEVNTHKESDVRRVLGPVGMMAERTGVTLLMLMHLNKGTGVQALYRSVGSIAFPAVARIVLGVAPDPNDEEGRRRLLLPVKMNVAEVAEGIGYRIERTRQTVLPRATQEDQPPIVAWDDEPVTIDVGSAMDRSGSAKELGEANDTKGVLIQVLSSGRQLSTVCLRELKEAGVPSSNDAIQRAKRELGVRSVKDGIAGPWYWELKNPSRARAYQPAESSAPSESRLGVGSAIQGSSQDSVSQTQQSDDSEHSFVRTREQWWRDE